MHHRRNRTTRREVKRMDSKSFRMAEREAMEGRSPETPPSWGWGRGSELPVPDVPSNGKKRGKRTRPKKDKCPAGKSHEWYKEMITTTEWVYPYAWTKREPYEVERTVEVWTCINCWKAHTPKHGRKGSWRRYRYGYSYRARPRTIPKRPIKELMHEDCL